MISQMLVWRFIAFMLPLNLAVLSISALSAQSVKDYERAAIEKQKRERAAEAAARQRSEQAERKRRAQQQRKAAIAEAQRQEKVRREREALHRAALCQQAVKQKDQPSAIAECGAAAELGSRIAAVHFGMVAQSQQIKDINLLNRAVNLLLINLSDPLILEDPNGLLGPPRVWGEEVEILLADLILDHEAIIFDYATEAMREYKRSGFSERQALIGVAYNIYTNSNLYKANLIYRPKRKRSDIFFNNKLSLYHPSKKINVVNSYSGESIIFFKDARHLAGRKTMHVYFDPYAEEVSCGNDGEMDSWAKQKCDFINGRISAAQDSRGMKFPYWTKITFITECDLTYYPSPQRDGYSYCNFRIESDD